MAPTSGRVGTTATMTVTSTSFFIEGDYKILWSSTSLFESGKTRILKEGTAPKGSLAVTNSFPIPEAPAGLYYVGFIRLGRDDPTIFSFTVVPYLRVQPLSTSPGSVVTVAGTGLPADSITTLTFDGNLTNTNAPTNKNGSFTIDFTIPDTPAGEHQISVTSTKIATPIPPTTILVVPAITVNPRLPEVGSNVTITGRGFAPKVLVSISFNELTIANSPYTNEFGSFTHSFTLPQSKERISKFVAKDAAGNTATFSGGSKIPTPPPLSPPPSQPSLQNPVPPSITALPKPTPLEPREQTFGLFGAQPVKFVWSQASSFAPNTITYTLEVSDNVKFSPIKPGMRVSNIAQTNFTLNLQPGTYYWRVKAISNSGSESEWAYSRYTFKVGAVPTWLFFIGGIVYLVVIYLLIRALLRRRQRYPYY